MADDSTPPDLTRDLKTAQTLPDGIERWVAESRALLHLARAQKDESECDNFLQQGEKLAEKAKNKAPDLPSAIELWIAHTGLYASHHKNLASLLRVKDLEKELLRLKKLAPQHDAAAADRGLAGLYLHAPVIISVGSMRKAKDHIEQALQRFPDHPANLLTYADVLIEDGKTQEARSAIAKALTATEMSENSPDSLEWKKQAAVLLNSISK